MLEEPMNKIALWIRIRPGDWAERVIIANNGKPYMKGDGPVLCQTIASLC